MSSDNQDKVHLEDGKISAKAFYNEQLPNIQNLTEAALVFNVILNDLMKFQHQL